MRWLRNGLVAVGALVLSGGIIAVADYFATQPGSGTSFGSVVVSAIHYAKMVIADPTTPTQVAAVSAGGALKVDGSAATQPVSGTVTANAGTNLNTSLLATAAKQPALGTAGTASTDVLTVQGIASMTALTVTGSGGTFPVTQSTSPWIVAGGGTAGTAATGVVTVQGIGSMTPLLVTPAANSAVNVAQVNGTTVLVNTGAVGTGSMRVAVGTDTATIAGSAPGTAGTASANVLTIQGVASMTPILVNPGTAANWGVVTQGSTTSGQSGHLDQCAVTTAPPSYTTAQTNPLSCDTTGNLRVTNTSALATGTNVIGGVFGQTNVTPTDCSGTITSGGTAQNAFTAGATKHGFTIVNLSTDPMWVSFTGTAVIGATASYLLPAGSTTVQGGSFTSPFGFGINTALSVIAATTSDKFSCTYW